MIEPLEARIAPAAVAGGKLTYTDVGGEEVTITFSKSSPLTNANFQFDTPFDATGQQQLQSINVGTFSTNIIVKAKGGDGHVNIGRITAVGVDLGKVSIPGDLGKITAGDSSKPGPAIKSLSVESMGEFGTTTQGATGEFGGAPDLQSFVTGGGTLLIKGDLEGAALNISGAPSDKLKLTVGGDVVGKAVNRGGFIDIQGPTVSLLKLGGIDGSQVPAPSPGDPFLSGIAIVRVSSPVTKLQVDGEIRGGGFALSGSLEVTKAVKTVALGGDITGGAGERSGLVDLGSDVGSLKLNGSVVGGIGSSSGKLSVFGTLKSGLIHGNLQGSDSTAPVTDTLFSRTGALELRKVGNLKVDGSVLGGSARESSGSLRIFELSGKFVLTGSLQGGPARSSGLVEIEHALGSVVIGSATGGVGENSGVLSIFDEAKNVRIVGDLSGGEGNGSGSFKVGRIVEALQINGSVKSGPGLFSGSVQSGGMLKRITVGQDLVGTPDRPVFIASSGADIVGIGELSVKGNVTSAVIRAGAFLVESVDGDASIGSVTIGGNFTASSIVAGIASTNAFFGDNDDVIFDEAGGNDAAIIAKIASVTIKGTVTGTTGSTTDSYGIVAEEIGRVTVGRVASALTSGPRNDLAGAALGGAADVVVREAVF